MQRLFSGVQGLCLLKILYRVSFRVNWWGITAKDEVIRGHQRTRIGTSRDMASFKKAWSPVRRSFRGICRIASVRLFALCGWVRLRPVEVLVSMDPGQCEMAAIAGGSSSVHPFLNRGEARRFCDKRRRAQV